MATDLRLITYLCLSIVGFVPRPTRLDFDQSSDGHPSVLETDLHHDKRPSYVPTPPERTTRYTKNNNHQDHHVTKVPVSFGFCAYDGSIEIEWYLFSRNLNHGTLVRNRAYNMIRWANTRLQQRIEFLSRHILHQGNSPILLQTL